jgi:hypothetical protein
MIQNPYEAPLQRTASAPYDLFPIPESKRREDVNPTTSTTKVCVAEIHFDTGNADKYSMTSGYSQSKSENYSDENCFSTGFCIAETNFDAHESESSDFVPSMSDKGSHGDRLLENQADPVKGLCLAELNFNIVNTETDSSDCLKLTGSNIKQDEVSINETYEKKNKLKEQEEASTNEAYEKIQKLTEQEEAFTNEGYEKLQKLTEQQEDTSTNEAYEKIQKLTEQEESSTNEAYEKLQIDTDDTDMPDVDSSSEHSTPIENTSHDGCAADAKV